jgi:hypothetical protein
MLQQMDVLQVEVELVQPELEIHLHLARIQSMQGVRRAAMELLQHL